MAGIPPQFLKNANASKAPGLPADKKKKARQKAIADMQKKDAVLDKKLGANDADQNAEKTMGSRQGVPLPATQTSAPNPAAKGNSTPAMAPGAKGPWGKGK